MENVNFVVTGQLEDLLIVIHKDDLSKLLKEDKFVTLVKGIKIDLTKGTIFGPQTISEWYKFIPFEPVEKGTQEMYHKLINRKVSDPVIANLIAVVEQNKLQSNEGQV